MQDEVEARRRRAVALALRGQPHAAVAKAAGVSQRSVSNWVRKYHSGGWLALQTQPGGPRAKLDARQAHRLRALIQKPPLAYGLPGHRWSLSILTKLIRKEFQVRLHPATVADSLHRHNITWQSTVDADRLLEWIRHHPGIGRRAILKQGQAWGWGNRNATQRALADLRRSGRVQVTQRHHANHYHAAEPPSARR